MPHPSNNRQLPPGGFQEPSHSRYRQSTAHAQGDSSAHRHQPLFAPQTEDAAIPPSVSRLSGGCMCILEGQSFYSPNDTVPLNSLPHPAWDSLGVEVKPFGPTSTLEDFSNPRQWTPAYGWTAFIPVYPDFVNPPFDRLLHEPVLMHYIGWTIDPETIRGWKDMEDAICDMVTYLINKYEIPAVAPFPPSHFGYTKKHTRYSDARRAMLKAREWFGVWQGLLSFCIAFARSRYLDTEAKRYPSWLELLARRGIGQHWLEAVFTSNVCIFTPQYRRAGIIVDLSLDQQHRPLVSWYVANGVPVWFRWGAEEMASQKLANFDYAPTPEAAQNLASTPSSSFAFAAPASPQPAASQSPSVPRAPMHDYAGEHRARKAQILEYIENKKTAFETLKKTASREEIQRWENRLRKPPTAKCRVTIWDSDPNDHYRLRAEKGTSRDLDDFSLNQSWYDPVNSIWHCCTDLAPGDPHPDDELNEMQEEMYRCLSPSPVAEPAVQEEMQSHRSPSTVAEPTVSAQQTSIATLPRISKPPPSNPASTAVTVDQLSRDSFLPPTAFDEAHLGDLVLGILTRYYGFVPPLPQPQGRAAASLGPNDRLAMLRMLGFHPSFNSSAPFFETELCAVAHRFLRALASAKRPNSDSWDIDVLNRDPLTRSAYLYKWRLVRNGGASLYLLDVPQPTRKWKLAVTNPVDATIVARMYPLDIESIALTLANQGVRFHTLSSCTRNSPCFQRPPPQEILYRQPNYQFSLADYEAYVKRRDSLLAEGRMRAAVLRGGFIWRIAVTFLSPEDALTGWSGAPGLSVVHPLAGDELVDDLLTPIEVQVICGAYKCIQPNDTVSIKSWWPLPESFDRDDAGDNCGRWTTYLENLFVARLKAIEQGTAVPLSIAQWRDKLRGRKEIRVMKGFISKEVASFLIAEAPATMSISILDNLRRSYEVLTQRVRLALRAHVGDEPRLRSSIVDTQQLLASATAMPQHAREFDEDPDEFQVLQDSCTKMTRLLEEACHRGPEILQGEPMLVEQRTGKRGRPKKVVSKRFLEKALKYRGPSAIARSLTKAGTAVSRRTIRRRALELRLVDPGQPVYQKIEHADGTVEEIWTRQGAPVSQITFHPEQLDRLVSGILTNHRNHGRVMIAGALEAMGYRVTRTSIEESYRRVWGAPAAFGSRRISRRTYQVAGANAMWHHDGHHALIRWKFVTHCFIDGYSRFITGLRVSTNNRAETVYQVFREATRINGLPEQVRGDHGTENTKVAAFMLIVRGGGRRRAYVWGPSVHNTRSERLWKDYHEGCIVHWYDFFYELEQSYGLDVDNSDHLWLLQHLFTEPINKHASEWAAHWNNHRISTARNKSPEELFLFGLVERGPRGIGSGTEEFEPTEYGVRWSFVNEEGEAGPSQPTVELAGDQAQAPQELAEIVVEPPPCPFPQDDVDYLDHRIEASFGDGLFTGTMDTRKAIWAMAAAICFGA